MQTDSKPRQIEVEEDQTEADVSEIHVKGNEKEMLLKQLHDQKKLKANHQLTSDSRESEKQPTDENTGQSSTHGHSESVFVSPEIRNVIAKEYDLADVGVDHHHLSDGKKKHKGRKSSKIKPEEENGAGHKARHEEEKQEMYYFDMSPAVKVPKAMMEKAVGTMKSVARGMEKHRPTFSDLGAKLKLTEKPKEVPAEKPKEESSIKTALSISTITVKEANKYSFLRNEKRRDVSVYENKFEEAGSPTSIFSLEERNHQARRLWTWQNWMNCFLSIITERRSIIKNPLRRQHLLFRSPRKSQKDLRRRTLRRKNLLSGLER